MGSLAKQTVSTIIPVLRYRDAAAAIEWLCDVFGFKKHLVVPGDAGAIVHAELTFGNGMIMVGSVVDSEFGRLMAQPDEFDGRETQCPYVVVTDVDAVASRAKSAGAVTVMDVKDEEYGGRSFACRDLEGRLWNFGTFDPWATSDR